MTNDQWRRPGADHGAKNEQVDKRSSGLYFAGSGLADNHPRVAAHTRAGRNRGGINSAADQIDADFNGHQPGGYNPDHVQPETSNETREEMGRRDCKLG